MGGQISSYLISEGKRVTPEFQIRLEKLNPQLLAASIGERGQQRAARQRGEKLNCVNTVKHTAVPI